DDGSMSAMTSVSTTSRSKGRTRLTASSPSTVTAVARAPFQSRRGTGPGSAGPADPKDVAGPTDHSVGVAPDGGPDGPGAVVTASVSRPSVKSAGRSPQDQPPQISSTKDRPGIGTWNVRIPSQGPSQASGVGTRRQATVPL